MNAILRSAASFRKSNLVNGKKMIIPAILEKDFEEIKKKIALLKNEARFFHIDVADGAFVPNTTFLEGEKMQEIIDNFGTYEVLNSRDFVNSSMKIGFEAHLMVERPHDHYKKWTAGGAAVIIFHIESFFNIKWKLREFAVNNLCRLIKKNGAQAALALNPETKIDLIEPYLMKNIFRVHFLSVQPGFQGNNFIPEVINKIRSLKQKYPSVKISVDGSVNEKTIRDLKAAGAEIFGVGSAIYKAQDQIEAFRKLQQLLSP